MFIKQLVSSFNSSSGPLCFTKLFCISVYIFIILIKILQNPDLTPAFFKNEPIAFMLFSKERLLLHIFFSKSSKVSLLLSDASRYYPSSKFLHASCHAQFILEPYFSKK